MRKLSVILMIIAGLSIIFGSCGKYEEGPAFSLRTKTARLTGEWEIDKVNVQLLVEVSEDQEEEFAQHVSYLKDSLGRVTFMFERGGEGTMAVPDLEIPEINFPSIVDIDWKFSNSNEELHVRIKTPGEYGIVGWLEYKILRLTNSELWLEDLNDYEHDVYVELRFEKQ